MPVLWGKCPGIVAADRESLIINKLSVVRGGIHLPSPSIVPLSLGFRSPLLDHHHHPSDWTRPRHKRRRWIHSTLREVPAAVEMRCSCQIVEPRLQQGKPQSSARVILLEKTAHELAFSMPSPHFVSQTLSELLHHDPKPRQRRGADGCCQSSIPLTPSRPRLQHTDTVGRHLSGLSKEQRSV
ncbi:hypothetical protein BC567DRAFT_17128 [Phyllosticta citribraziliensis]